MEEILIADFIKLVLPLLLQELVKSGAMTQLTASTITCYEDFSSWLKTLQTYSAPIDFPNPPSEPTPCNIENAELKDG